ncbi:sulfate adenylyltransferase subunit CysN [Labrys wisconsinensis]|uniref:Multifunctional fusion protein n=1 Tax=Labrys wisconsinensis TaxID=425677 RepID=A0ABU0J7S9_9HYPH|nr:sulfate adenylyltransferase subunit CysN [Labrys wisconsinensis]MDQ0470314.1 bifunctional enzyme CysN/CysC [Labrys wisconsinensis]
MTIQPSLAEMLKPREKGLLRFLTCGSVDDGKSTLIGRLLYDSKLIFEDQLATLEKDSRRHGTTGEDIDFALLVDGLEAEREQGITIDVAYRFFSTARRSFIVADTPGHEQYTRNMATGASTADLAVLMIDARKGVLVQTKRHATICSLLGIRHIVVAVNKIDLTGHDRAVFERIVADFTTFAANLGFSSIQPIPMSARYGDNVSARSGNMSWYHGPSLIEHLESVDIESDAARKPFRLAVQWVNRPNLDFRGFAGTIASGSIRPGDTIVVASSGKSSTVTRIVTADGDLDEARAGEAVTLTLADEIDAARGDVFARPAERPEVADQFAAHLIWMAEEAMLPGRSYMMRIGTKFVPATVTGIAHKIDVNTQEKLAARTLVLNEIGVVNVATAVPVAFDPYRDNRETGAFILIDRTTNQTAAAGMIDVALRRATNVHRQAQSVDKAARARLKHQKPAILWFTGLSGSGKSTIANIVEKRLAAVGHHTMLLDGDNMRHGLNKDLGFTDADRVENIRRVGEVAKLFVESGTIVLCSFISPFEAERSLVRGMVEADEFIEVFVDTPLEDCIKRDPKGLYAKALAGQIRNFTGIDSPYERPADAELVIRTAETGSEAAAEAVIKLLRARGHLEGEIEEGL